MVRNERTIIRTVGFMVENGQIVTETVFCSIDFQLYAYPPTPILPRIPVHPFLGVWPRARTRVWVWVRVYGRRAASARDTGMDPLHNGSLARTHLPYTSNSMVDTFVRCCHGSCFTETPVEAFRKTP